MELENQQLAFELDFKKAFEEANVQQSFSAQDLNDEILGIICSTLWGAGASAGDQGLAVLVGLTGLPFTIGALVGGAALGATISEYAC